MSNSAVEAARIKVKVGEKEKLRDRQSLVSSASRPNRLAAAGCCYCWGNWTLHVQSGLLPALFVPVRWPCFVVYLAPFVVYDNRGFADGIGGYWTRLH